MQIDNFSKLKNLCVFSDDSFYVIQVIQRKKENKHLKKSKTIKTFYINNNEYLESIKDDIITLCKVYNARAYITTDRKSMFKVINEINKKTNELITIMYYDKEVNLIKQLNKLTKSIACSDCSSIKNNKVILVDVDVKDRKLVDNIILDYNDYFIELFETINGYHILFERMFNPNFIKQDENITVKTNALTLLYSEL